MTCQTVSPKHAHPHANGILAIEDGKALAVADSLEGTVSFYRVDPVSKILTMELKVVSTNTKRRDHAVFYGTAID